MNTKKLILAPMATLSHEAFRRLVARFGGCDEYFTEMINAGSLQTMGPFEKYYLMAGPEPEKIVWQLTGNRTDYLVDAAQILVEQGGLGIDLNMGCSAPQIYKTGAGIAWMIKPRCETEDMVKAIRRVVPDTMRLSVKLRLGDDDFTEDGLMDFCHMLVDSGVQMLTLHPRTKKEKFRGHPRWQFVEMLAKEFPDIPVILNGEVIDSVSYGKAVEAAPSACGVMIARAAAQKPWIFAQLRNPEKRLEVDCEQLALDFIDFVEQFQPQEFWKTRLQRFFAYYCQNFSFAHYFTTQMINADGMDDSRARVKEYFCKCPDDKCRVY